ncbi:MAG: class I SAM-dependent rRNA methyltransferase [Bacteroidales bacterium]|nr:class I SAM-dependent rRNA methyltransferase [Bacteroidales bacterium]
MTTYTRVILNKGKDEPVRRFHPWVFSGAIQEIKGDYREGDIVEVFSSDQKYLATGYLLSGSIAIKLFSFKQEEINDAFWKSKLLSAFKAREKSGLTANTNTTAYRLVHNEGDSMPGLIIDIYGDLAVLQAHSVGMYQLRESFAKALTKIYGGNLKAIFDKSSESLKKMTGFRVEDGFLLGEGEEFEVLENGHKFLIHPASGQKTGFFLDQRDNREMISRYAAKANVLNMFGYTGGFSVYAAAGGAKSVHTVDSSRPAIELAEKNMEINGFKKKQHQAIVADAKEYLQQMEEGAYNLIILDPPAYAKTMDARKKALSGYRSINALAFKKIAPGGILFTFSCSQVVDRQMFFSAVTAAAIDAGRKVRVLHQLSQPPDHPINIFHQEGEYLKGLVLSVE